MMPIPSRLFCNGTGTTSWSPSRIQGRAFRPISIPRATPASDCSWCRHSSDLTCTAPSASRMSWLPAILPQSLEDEPRSSSRRASAPKSSEQAGRAPNVTLAGKRVVIVEDEGITVMQLRRMLVRAGMLVVGTAGNGKEGIETVLRERPDIVLMDIKMPVMDGLEAARRILETYPVCILMLTAYSTAEYQHRA